MEDLGWLPLMPLILSKLGPTLVGLMFGGAWLYISWVGHRVTRLRGFRLLLVGSAIQLAIRVLLVVPDYVLHFRMMRSGASSIGTTAIWIAISSGIGFLIGTLAAVLSFAGMVSIVRELTARSVAPGHSAKGSADRPRDI